MKLQGIKPQGGTVIEVHIDLRINSVQFNAWLETLGFEDDPFIIFYPSGYAHHMTGRLLCGVQDLHATLEKIRICAESVVARGRSDKCPLYVEVELVRAVARFEGDYEGNFSRILDRHDFSHTGKFGRAKADVHVEFPFGKVTDEVRQYLLEKKFYWVATPQTVHFPAEEIATLQTVHYPVAKAIYEVIVERPFPFCKADHLEQKTLMLATDERLPMPETIRVTDLI